ncbi:hypothetical protein PS15m_009547 [Mucor circinelloides]
MANVDQVPRKLMRRRVDMVFKLQPNEYGCIECGRYESNSTKELAGEMFKISIIMKDMLNVIAKAAFSLVNELTIPSLMIIDLPIGHVCRVNRIKPQYFPACSVNLMNPLVCFMRLVYTARLSMESTLSLVSEAKRKLEYDLGDDTIPIFQIAKDRQQVADLSGLQHRRNFYKSFGNITLFYLLSTTITLGKKSKNS